MRFPMTVLRVVALGPTLLVSFVLAVVVCALLPPALGLVCSWPRPVCWSRWHWVSSRRLRSRC